jgi:1,5-anhydro-D-fructose reductase (1,5-anhydro-D-mannitol-forming)
MSIEHAREMADACAEAEVILRIAHQIRLDEAMGRAREIVQSGRLGRLTAISLERASGLDVRPPWREDVRQSGVLFDVGVHLIDLIQWISGADFVEVSAFTHPDRREGTPDDTVSVLGRLDDDCQAIARATREVAAALNNLVIEGREATLITSALRFAKHHTITILDGKQSEEQRFEATPAYARQIAAFEDELRGTRSVLPDGEDALQTVAVTQAIQASIEHRRIMQVPPARG